MNRWRTAAVCTFAALTLSSCWGRGATQSLLLHVLNDRRAACEDIGDSMAGAWGVAHELKVQAERTLAGALLYDDNVQRVERVKLRKRQAGDLFQKLGAGSESEAGRALLDIGGQVEAYCSLVTNPVGFSLITFNAKRSELRVELEEVTARAALLIPPVVEGPTLEALNNEILVAERRIAAGFAARDRELAEKKHREEVAAAEKASAERAQAAQAQFDRDAAAERAVKLREETAAKRDRETAALEERRRVANAERTARECTASRTWLEAHGKEMRVVANQVERMDCSQLAAAAKGALTLAAPPGADRRVQDLADSFDQAAKACTVNNHFMLVSARSRVATAMSNLSAFGGDCGLRF